MLKRLRNKLKRQREADSKPAVPLDTKIRSGYRVVGPNTADHRQSTWYFPSLEEAKRFANHIATDLDAEYDILKYVGTIRQVPLPPRAIEWLEGRDTKEQ